MFFRGLLIVSYFYLLHLLISSSFLFSLAQHHPIRPVLSESFNAQIYVQYIDIPNQDTVLGEGFIGRDNKKLKQVVSLNIIKFDSPTIYYQLKRYDLRRIFTVTEDPRMEKFCDSEALTGPFGEVWDWVGLAKCVATVDVDGNKFDIWNHTVKDKHGVTTQSLWVNRSNPNKPVRYVAESIKANISVVDFKTYHPSPPSDPRQFDVPKICQEVLLPNAKHYMNFSQDFDDERYKKNNN